MKILKNIKLSKYTTFHIGGKAKHFAEIKNIKDLEKAVEFAEKNELKIFILGGGSNLLLPDRGLDCLVLKMNIKGVNFEDKGDLSLLMAGAGEKWDEIVAMTVKKGLSGIENLSLIPGTVGGAVYQNIGAYGVELKDTLKSVEVFDIRAKVLKSLSVEECDFSYRNSIFQNSSSNFIILKATIGLLKIFAPNIKYPDLVKYFENKEPTLQETRKAVIKIRKSKLVYPTKSVGTAGSFFKNPVISSEQFKNIKLKHPDIRGRENKDSFKLSAGQIIEKAGWKGRRLNNVGVSAKHALVLVSYKGAKAGDIVKLSEMIQKSVKSKFNIVLEPEVRIMR